MENLEKESFWQLECKECEFESITTMLWFLIEDYYIGVKQEDIYTKANNYDRLGIYLNNIHSLLFTKQKEMKEFIDKVYAERNAMKEGVTKCV